MVEWSRDLPPSEEALIRAWIDHALNDLQVALPGRVESYDATTQTANIQPLVRHARRLPDGTTEHEDYPVIPSVPVLWPRAGGWFLAMHLAAGDTVQLLVNSAAIGHWRVGTGEVTDPGDLRRHHLAHAVAIPGLATRGAKLRHAPAEANGMAFGEDADGGTRVTIDSSGTIIITRAATELMRVATNGEVTLGGTAGAQFIALANLVDARLTSIRDAFNAHTHTETGGATGVPNTLIGALASVAATKGKSR